MEEIAGLLERRVKHLHFSPPRFTTLRPATVLAAHPLFEDVPATEFCRARARLCDCNVYIIYIWIYEGMATAHSYRCIVFFQNCALIMKQFFLAKLRGLEA